MSRYIVDASIVVQLLITDVHTVEVVSLFKGIAHGDRVIIPEFGLLECTNVLWKHVRFHGIAASEAALLVKTLIALDIDIPPVTGLVPRALEIGLKHQLAVYDALYLALAEQFRYPFITDDQRQAKAAAAEGMLLKSITDFTA